MLPHGRLVFLREVAKEGHRGDIVIVGAHAVGHLRSRGASQAMPKPTVRIGVTPKVRIGSINTNP